MLLRVATAFLFALAAGSAARAADDAKLMALGRHLAQECTACHRSDGGQAAIPSITGWDVDTFIKTVGFYRDGARTNPVMVSVAASLDAEQTRALALYLSTLPKQATAPK